jgi:hypothetical protein
MANKSFLEQMADFKILFQSGLLNYEQFLYLLQNILTLEMPKVRLLPAWPLELIPDTSTFIYKDTESLSKLTDTITYRIILQTAANEGGDKTKHGSPFHASPQPGESYVNPDNANEIIQTMLMLYDITIQFDLFAHTHAQLEKLVTFFIRLMHRYRDFIKHMGISEFQFHSRLEDVLLRERYAKTYIPFASIQYFLRIEEVYLLNATKLDQIKITINNEVKKTLNLNK